MDKATSKFRAWVKLYQEFKWLNSFAMTNECAFQTAMKIMKDKIFIVNSDNLLTENFQTIFDKTHMANDETID